MHSPIASSLGQLLRATSCVVIASALSVICAASRGSEQKTKEGALHWTPPNVDAPIESLASTPPCELPVVLERATGRAKELIDNLQNFTARETIQVLSLDSMGAPDSSESARYEYAVNFDENGGDLSVKESRAPASKSDGLTGGVPDVGLSALAVIFHPAYRDDYDMKCEGMATWEGHPTWVLHFQQKKAQRARTLTLRTQSASYPAKLKGRAWIAADSYQIQHLEVNLIDAIPMLSLRSDAIALDYAPVQFTSRGIQLWLPREARTFADYEKTRYIVRHSFTNFLLSSVDIQQLIGAPPKP